MELLREKIARIVHGEASKILTADFNSARAAAAILAIPEIREALALKARQDLADEAQRLKLGY